MTADPTTPDPAAEDAVLDSAAAAQWLERLTALLGMLRDAADPDAPDASLDARRDAARRVRTAVRLARARLACTAEACARLAEARALCDAAPTDAPGRADELALYAEITGALPPRSSVRREFYVYVHRAPDGEPFYVGKGRGRRAWSRARTGVWRRYVDGRLGGRYDVEIHRDGLTHGEALALEAELLARFGARLVNWINPGRDFDVDAVERARLLRAETLGLVGTTQFFETTAPDEAVRRYRRALDDVRVYCRLPVERGLLAELKDADRVGEPIVLDRLTRCLERLGRTAELVAVADRYFADFPDAEATSAGQRVRRRRERAARSASTGAGPRGRPRERRVLG